MDLFFVIAPEAISSHGLHDANQNIAIIVLPEFTFVDMDFLFQRTNVIIEQLLTGFLWNISLGIVQERCHIILQSSASPSLVVDEKQFALMYHDITRLKIAVQKVMAIGLQQVFGKNIEIIFQFLFVEIDMSQFQKIIFEIVQIPHHGLFVKLISGIAYGIIHIGRSLRLKPQ